MHRDGADSLEIFCHVLADKAVAARRAADKLALNVFKRHRKAVNLRLDAVNGIRLGLADAGVKFLEFFEGKNVLKAFQRDGVAHLLKGADRLAADAPRRAEG